MDIHKVSSSQIEELLDYLSTHSQLVKGVGSGARSKELQDKMWDDLALRLNAHGRGATKTGQRWKRYWISIKHKVKSKASARNQDFHGTGGGPPKQDGLSDVELKIMALIGEKAVFGDTEHQIPIFTDQPLTSQPVESVPTSTISASIAHPSSASPVPDHLYALNTDYQESHIDAGDASAEIEIEVPQRSASPTDQHPAPTETQVRKTSGKKTKESSKIDPDLILKLEDRRVAAEEKLAEAAFMIAQAALTNSQAANTNAQAVLIQAQNFSQLLEYLNSRHQTNSCDCDKENRGANIII